MPTATLTVNLAVEELEFLQQYARQHGLTAAEVVGRYVQRLKSRAREEAIHPEVSAITGLVPADSDVGDDYHCRQLKKHQ